MGDLDSEGNLQMASGRKVPRLAINPAMFLDKTVTIYGPSGTGKTVLTKHIMKTLNGYIDQVIVVSPSEPANRSYEGIVDPPLMHFRVYLPDPANPKKDDGTRGTQRFLQAIWDRQMMMKSIYTRANNAAVLSLLFGRLPPKTRREGIKFIKIINDKRSHVIKRVQKQFGADPGRCTEKIKEANEKFQKMLALIYKKYITPHYEELFACADLSEDEEYSLTYLQFNPRLLLVFDDCAAELKPLFNKEVFRRLFYRGRHADITSLICCQDDTDVPANLRKNAFVSIFTEPVVCMSNFERQANKFPKPTKLFAAEIAGEVFVANRKLVYIREDPRRQHFYHVEVPYPKPFRFGSEAFHELCESVQNTGDSMDTENPYYGKFAIKGPSKK